MTRRSVPALLVLTALTACALPQSQIPVLDGTIYQGTRDPMQYRSALPHEGRFDRAGPREASGEACRSILTFPPSPPAVFKGSDVALAYLPWPSFAILGGNDGYALAMKRARESAGGAPLFDVRADLHTTAWLGIWRTECVEIHALVGTALAAAAR